MTFRTRFLAAVPAALLLTTATVAANEAAAPAAAVGADGKPAQAAACAGCHGEAGVSAVPMFPTIAGQHASYLEFALKGYKDGTRKNAIMAGQAAALSAADIKALAAWYAAQPSPLYTVAPEGEAPAKK